MIFYLAIDTNNNTKILGTQADAAKVNEIYEQIDIPTDKAGLMAWVQQMLDETLNVQTIMGEILPYTEEAAAQLPAFDPDAAVPIPAPPLPIEETFAQKTVRIEEEFNTLPLAFKFHLAAIAMEEGREILGRVTK